ncbi:NAD(P)-dependent oxidoreductase [Paraburkholderia sp.]|uniref:NAD(P)-dependent oxidoreductase n=1 Tax=Paraburkholderia sp. TaxID=1926495 RepID=UPI003C7DC333
MTTDVSVIGLGNMGYALARAFARAGNSVTVWNRNAAKAAGLEATVAASVAEAIASSPVTVFCVATNENVTALLGEASARGAARSKTIINFTTGTPQEATQVEKVVTECGAEFLAGIIPSYPEQIGTPEIGMIMSGPKPLWERHQKLISALGGVSWHAGELTPIAATLDMAMAINFYHTALGVFIESAKYAMNNGVSKELLLRLSAEALDYLKFQIPHVLESMVSGDFETNQATIDVHHSAMQMASRAMADMSKTRSVHMTSMLDDLQRASEAGLGGKAMAAISAVMR